MGCHANDGGSSSSGGGGSGTGSSAGASSGEQTACYQKPSVQTYLASVEKRTLGRWNLPPGVAADQKVTLRFQIDVAGDFSNNDDTYIASFIYHF